MPRKRRRGRIPTPAWERHQRGSLGRRLLEGTPKFYATLGIVLLVLAAVGVVGFAFLADYRADQRRPDSAALKIEDTKYTLRYFTERVKTLVRQAGGARNLQPALVIQAVTEQLVQEQILLRFAGERGQSASEDDVNTEIATRLGITKEDPNFPTRLQEELTRTGLTDAQYREMISAAVLLQKVRDKFATGLPASAESVRYRQIVVADQSQADDIETQIEGGADFAVLAQEKSLDTQTKSGGGDAGWVPRGALDEAVEDHLFSQELGKVTTYAGGGALYIYQVTEKAVDREIDESQKSKLAEKRLQDWLEEKRSVLKIEEFIATDEDKIRYVEDHAFETA